MMSKVGTRFRVVSYGTIVSCVATVVILISIACSKQSKVPIPRKTVESTVDRVLSTPSISHEQFRQMYYAANYKTLHSLDSLKPLGAGNPNWSYATAQEKHAEQLKWVENARLVSKQVTSQFDSIFVLEDSVERVYFSPDDHVARVRVGCSNMRLPRQAVGSTWGERDFPISNKSATVMSLSLSGHSTEEIDAGGLSYNVITGKRAKLRDFIALKAGEFAFNCPLDLARQLDIVTRKGVIRQLVTMKPVSCPVSLRKFVGEKTTVDSIYVLGVGFPREYSFAAVWLTDSDTLLIPAYDFYRQDNQPLSRHNSAMK